MLRKGNIEGSSEKTVALADRFPVRLHSTAKGKAQLLYKQKETAIATAIAIEITLAGT